MRALCIEKATHPLELGPFQVTPLPLPFAPLGQLLCLLIAGPLSDLAWLGLSKLLLFVYSHKPSLKNTYNYYSVRSGSVYTSGSKLSGKKKRSLLSKNSTLCLIPLSFDLPWLTIVERNSLSIPMR